MSQLRCKNIRSDHYIISCVMNTKEILHDVYNLKSHRKICMLLKADVLISDKVYLFVLIQIKYVTVHSFVRSVYHYSI